ncbi:MAG: M24 family metallopeptidase, partial [Chloroflexota bacterium]
MKLKKKKRLGFGRKKTAKPVVPPGIIIKTPEQIEGIRKSGHLTRDILDMLTDKVQPGITTNQIDQWIYDYMVAHGGRPATLGYKDYPKSTCTSINDVICHGIPDETVLQDGDILNIDVTTILNGYYGDSSRMYVAGNASGIIPWCVRVSSSQEPIMPGKAIQFLKVKKMAFS